MYDEAKGIVNAGIVPDVVKLGQLNFFQVEVVPNTIVGVAPRFVENVVDGVREVRLVWPHDRRISQLRPVTVRLPAGRIPTPLMLSVLPIVGASWIC